MIAPYINLLGPMQTTKQQKKYLRENVGLTDVAWEGFSENLYEDLERAIIAIATANSGGPPINGAVIQYVNGHLVWSAIIAEESMVGSAYVGMSYVGSSYVA